MAKKKPSESTTDESGSANFEEALNRVAEIVEQLEGGDLPLGESLQAYEEGIKHLKVCYDALSDAERKIEQLAGFDAAGNPVTQTFDDTASGSGEDQVGRRSRETTKGAKSPPRGKESMIDDNRELF